MIKYLLVLLLLTIPLVIFSQNPCPGTPTVNYFGKIYNTVQIGNQCWLKENLNVGNRINVNQNQSNNGTIEKYCYSDDENNCNTYGGLYQWNEAMQYVTTPGTKGICPDGWHIPTIAEFETLAAAVNHNSNSLKAVGQGTGDGAGTNSSGFTALLGGFRHVSMAFGYLGMYANVWSSTEHNLYSTTVHQINLYSFDNRILFINYNKEAGFTIRCIKDDNGTEIHEEPSKIPNGFSLLQNYPNPFNPGTVIQFSIPNEVYVTLSVFNTLGEQVTELVNQQLSPSTYSVNFDAKDLPNGIYFYKIQAGEFVQTKKMILMK
jgi:uncharacterized protein (TIGR02145 family)